MSRFGVLRPWEVFGGLPSAAERSAISLRARSGTPHRAGRRSGLNRLARSRRDTRSGGWERFQTRPNGNGKMAGA